MNTSTKVLAVDVKKRRKKVRHLPHGEPIGLDKQLHMMVKEERYQECPLVSGKRVGSDTIH